MRLKNPNIPTVQWDGTSVFAYGINPKIAVRDRVSRFFGDGVDDDCEEGDEIFFAELEKESRTKERLKRRAERDPNACSVKVAGKPLGQYLANHPNHDNDCLWTEYLHFGGPAPQVLVGDLGLKEHLAAEACTAMVLQSERRMLQYLAMQQFLESFEKKFEGHHVSQLKRLTKARQRARPIRELRKLVA